MCETKIAEEGRGRRTYFAGSGRANKYLKTQSIKLFQQQSSQSGPLSETNIFKANKTAPDQSARTVRGDPQKNRICPDFLPQIKHGSAKWFIRILSFKCGLWNLLLDSGARNKPPRTQQKKAIIVRAKKKKKLNMLLQRIHMGKGSQIRQEVLSYAKILTADQRGDTWLITYVHREQEKCISGLI